MLETRLWITWERQPRNRSMANRLKADLEEVVVEKSRIQRYALSIVKTVLIINRVQPRILFVQNPSIVLSFIAVFLRIYFNYKLVVDQHNAGIYPLEGKSNVLNFLSAWILRKADLNIVTNDELLDVVESLGGRAIVAPDPLPEMPIDQSIKFAKFDKSQFNIVFICSWDNDEPYNEVIESASLLLGERVEIYITGNYRKKLSFEDLKKIPDNVNLLGFISYAEYCALLNVSSAVIVLTKRKSCINCGIYEALALGKPGVVTKDKQIEKIFYRGYSFSEIDPVSITKNIKYIINNYEKLIKDVFLMKMDFESHHSTVIREINNAISRL
ncbi:glycosyltransferase [Marinobacter sp. MIT932201]|uniref:glycosyltransferase n=1 Tax=Marinobacter sp. MIT932201 TaxID=3096995 RepID=UPI0039999F2E